MSTPKWTPDLEARCLAAARAARSEPETVESLRDALVASEAARVAAEERARVLGEALAAALPFVERAAEEDQSYGYFLGGLVGGDPRQFSPDEECATAAEIAQHKADCEAWNRGDRPVHRVMTLIDPARSIAGQLKGSDSAMLERDAEGYVTGGHVHRAGYGLGVTVFRDPDAVAALEKARTALASLPAAPAEEPAK